MSRDCFSHVETWVFDLDHTLYPPSAQLFEQIKARMSDWIADALGVSRDYAVTLRDHYWQRYGTTLAGLIAEHNVDPGPFLGWVHDISFDALDPDPDLRARIADLPGRRIVFTNGPTAYASQVIEARGFTDLFDAVYAVEDTDLQPKPQPEAFDLVFAKDGLDPKRAAMFEDTPANLKVPHARGMRTVHVAPAPDPADYIHHHTDDLTDFLSQLVKGTEDLGSQS